MSQTLIRLLAWILAVLLVILTGVAFGVAFVYQKGFSQIERLEDIKPEVMTTVYDRFNRPLREFARERRMLVRFQDIPHVFRKAIIAAEDDTFYDHWGINFRGVVRAVLSEVAGLGLGGGSSITQQLARSLYLTPERTYTRKLHEMFLAIQIERRYSKDQILTYHCNKAFFGGKVYGVGAAAHYYFGKDIRELSLAEAALIAGILPAPNGKFNVFKYPDQALGRRNRVLRRMLELGFINEIQYEMALGVSLPKMPFKTETHVLGDYFMEEVRKNLEEKYGQEILYQGGLNVYTTLDVEMQRWAEDSLKEGLRDLDKRQGWRKDRNMINLLDQGADITTYELPSWKGNSFAEGSIVEGIVVKRHQREARIRIGPFEGRLAEGGYAWTKKPLSRLLKPGDTVRVKIVKRLDEGKRTMELSLEQVPEVQGALMVIENETGAVLAMVGGYSFTDSQWNNATQARRQTGSTIKPIVYTAALENGYTPSTLVLDEPFSYFDPSINEVWEPRNHTEDYKGQMTLRRAFEQSRNVVSARIVEYLGPAKIVQYANRFGITSDLKPYMSIALGAFGITLEEMVGAYTVFPNLGVRVKPYLIRSIADLDNREIERNLPDRKRVIDPDTAYLVNYLMQGVVKHGSGWRARHLKAPIGGKTGTTNNYTDAWFIGFSPGISVGVWVGFEVNKSLGEEETGGRAASPIFVSFMEKYLQKYQEPPDFVKPAGVILLDIDRKTGKRLNSGCLYPFQEAFLAGTEPEEYTQEEDRQAISDYYGIEEGED